MTTTKPAIKAAPKKRQPQPAKSPHRPGAGLAVKRGAKTANESMPEPTSLLEALICGKATMIKVRGNGTRRSMPYLAPGTEQRTQAELVASMREKGATIEEVAEKLSVSLATARRFLSNLALAHAVEAGDHNAAWTQGNKEVVVRTVPKLKV